MIKEKIKINKKSFKNIAFILVLIGSINWGLIGVSVFLRPFKNLNLVNLIFGNYPIIEFLIYILVGISGLYLIAKHRKNNN